MSQASRLSAVVLLACVAAEGAAARPRAGLGAPEEQAREAFYRGDYAAMAAAYVPRVEQAMAGADGLANEDPRRLTSYVNNHLDDCVGLGHAHQLAGKWRQAVAGYEQALALVELALKARMKKAPPAELTTLVRQRAFLLWLIGRIQREALNDPAAAAATLAKGSDFTPYLKRPLDALVHDRAAQMRRALQDEPVQQDHKLLSRLSLPLRTMQELAITQQRLGRPADALATLTRANLTSQIAYGLGARANVSQAAALLRAFGAGAALPRTPGLIVLSPARPALTLRLDDPQALANSYVATVSRRTSRWSFALCPPPGQEFATVVFACDIEQFQLRYGGHFACSAESLEPRRGVVSLGMIGWHNEGPPGRKVIRRRFDVPPGADLLHVTITQWKGKFKVHSVSAQAEFRPQQDAELPLKLRIQSQLLPEGGELTCNGQPVRPGVAFTDLKPGRYVFEYRAPGHPKVFRCEADLVGGGRYGLFANLDSPFQWALTTLRGFGDHPPPRASLVRLPDGRWLVAYGTGRSVELATSQDGVTWSEPWTLPQASLFRRIEPTLHIDGDGTLWLAYFSDRLRGAFGGTGQGYNLWLRRSRDGRTWSPPRPIAVEGTQPRRSLPGPPRPPWKEFQSLGSWPWGAVHLAQAPDGRHWLFWRDYVASGESPDDIGPLRKLDLGGVRLTNPRSPHVTFDARGRLHLVFSDHRRGICYTASADGVEWTPPVTLCESRRSGFGVQAQLILDGERAALLYGGHGTGFLRRGVLEPKPKFGPAIRITNQTIPLNGSRAWVGPDGQVLLLAGQDTVWLLRAHRRALARGAVTDF